MNRWNSPEDFYNERVGKQVDVDNYPVDNPFQCFDLMAYFLEQNGLSRLLIHCNITRYVQDIWTNRANLVPYFDIITDKNYKNGDWVIFPNTYALTPFSHVCMYWNGMAFGQNQLGVPAATLQNLDFSRSLGGFRWKPWSNMVKVPEGASDQRVGDVLLHLYRQKAGQKVGVLCPQGLNQLASFEDFDNASIVQMAKICNGNYFQMREGQDDKVGTFYGDISAPMNAVYMNLSQNAVLYYDLETGEYGECADITIDEHHNVFSPAIVGRQLTYDYAPMVGKSFYAGTSSLYSFVIRFTDGTYALGCNDTECTPKAITEACRQMEGFESVAIVDGGGSSMFGRANAGRWEVVRRTDRRVASAIVLYTTEEIEEPDGAGETAQDRYILELEKRVRRLENIILKLSTAFNEGDV